MAYENVDVTRARNAINQCLNSINYNNSSNILNDSKDNKNWNADSKTTFRTALDTLVNTRYKELKDYLNQCLTTINNIEKYKNLQSQNATYDSQIRTKSAELSTQQSKYRKLDDKSTAEAKNIKSKIDKLEREIKDLKNKRENNSSDMVDVNKNIIV